MQTRDNYVDILKEGNLEDHPPAPPLSLYLSPPGIHWQMPRPLPHVALPERRERQTQGEELLTGLLAYLWNSGDYSACRFCTSAVGDRAHTHTDTQPMEGNNTWSLSSLTHNSPPLPQNRAEQRPTQPVLCVGWSALAH